MNRLKAKSWIRTVSRALDSRQTNGAPGSSAPERGKGSGSASSHGIMFVNFIQLIYSCRAHETEIEVLLSFDREAAKQV